MDVLDQLAVALGFATLAGLNLYLTVLVTGMAIRFHWIELLPQYEALGALGEWPVLVVTGVLFLLETLTIVHANLRSDHRPGRADRYRLADGQGHR